MKRKERTTILVKGDSGLAKELAEEIIANYFIEVIQESQPGLVMVKVRESAQQKLFYLGEVLVTECKVQINGHLGLGIIQGEQGERAYYLAVIDAAYNANLVETQAWATKLAEEKQAIQQQEAREMASISKTRVNFTTMEI